MRRYVFSEFTPLEELTAGETLALLAREELFVYVAFPPQLRSQAAEVVRRCQGAGVAIGIWPLLEDRQGRWANSWNGAEFADYCLRLLDELHAVDAVPDEVIIDLEPPISATKRILAGRPTTLRRPSRGGAAALAEMVRKLGAICPVSAVAVPWAACGDGAGGWQRLLGTPIDGLAFERVFIMAYTSLIEGYSAGTLRRRHAEALLAHWSKRMTLQFGDRGGIAVGVAGIGALGDERAYRDATELGRDVSLARLHGCEHLALFNLRGVLSREEPSRWFDALRESREVAGTSSTVRTRALLRVLDVTGRIFDKRDRVKVR